MNRRPPFAPRRPLPLAFALTLLAGAAALPGQSAPPPLTFGETIEVRVVNFEVVVTDRQGLPVTGLGPVDFKLLVDGKEMPVGYFTEVRGGDAVATDPGAVADIPGVPALAPGEAVGTSYLVFVDDYFALARDRDRVLRSLIADLAHLGPEDRMAIVAYDGRKLTMLSTWSNSQAALERAIKKATERPTFGLQRMAERSDFDRDRRLVGNRGLFRQSLDTQVQPHEQFYVDRLEGQVETMVSGATAALRGFAAPPGRKVMLLLSGGWPYSPAEYAVADLSRPVHDPRNRTGDELYRPLIDTANQVGYTLYGVDVPGLGGAAADAELESVPAAGEAFEPQLRENTVQYTLERVARATGGKALLNTRREQALARVTADTRSYYWLGFQPQWQGDDKDHDVRVQVQRPGLKVRSRSGYVDFSRQREVTLAVESALLFGNPPNALPLGVEIGAPQKSGAGKMKVKVKVAVPATEVTLLPSGDRLVGRLELRVAALDSHGGRSEIPVIPIDLASGKAPVAGQAVRYETVLELRRQPTELVLALYDPASGKLFTAAVEVRP